ncbi:MAG: nucleotide-binding protein [Candidatus Methanoperedens sp.]|nr:nucleotide-binding protein [Candidatus Methanoperedens sp.]
MNNLEKNQKLEKGRLSQTDVPAYSLEQALRVAKAIVDNYASAPTTPLNVAKAMNMSPTSGPFRMITGAAIAYGLTNGGYNAKVIALESLGKRIFEPTEENDDVIAKKEAFLHPRIINEFLTKYNGKRLPREDIAKNVLKEMGVPKDRLDSTFKLIMEGANSLGLITKIKEEPYVDLSAIPITTKDVEPIDTKLDAPPINGPAEEARKPDMKELELAKFDSSRKKRVFLTHGKNTEFLEPIKKLLKFGELDPVVSTEKQTVSQPVPDKVLNDMRDCGAAIIHVNAEEELLDKKGTIHAIINPNVLIEIGAAMALYGRRFILLVKEGVNLPSNLQGLYEVRYTGDALDVNDTIKLLEAINNMKQQLLPEENSSIASQ